jgi:hypothetical protein
MMMMMALITIIEVQGGLNTLACSIFKGNLQYQFMMLYVSMTCKYLYLPVYTEAGSLQELFTLVSFLVCYCITKMTLVLLGYQ